MIPILDTPMERAASTTPGSVETRLCSTSLDDASVHMMTMGKVAAVLPMDVPISWMEIGCIAARNMINGIGRITLMMISSTL